MKYICKQLITLTFCLQNHAKHKTIENHKSSDLATEFLLHFPDKPHMDFPESLPQSVRYMDNNSFPIPRNINLTIGKKIADQIIDAQNDIMQIT